MNDIFYLYLCIIFVLFQSGESESIVRTGHDHYPLPFSIIAKKKNLPFVQEFCHSGRNKFPLTNLLQILEPTVTFKEYKLIYYLLVLVFQRAKENHRRCTRIMVYLFFLFTHYGNGSWRSARLGSEHN